jgi:hypothetical protein
VASIFTVSFKAGGNLCLPPTFALVRYLAYFTLTFVLTSTDYTALYFRTLQIQRCEKAMWDVVLEG